jgi:hypothetical protein
MKSGSIERVFRRALLVVILVFDLPSTAATHYVDANSANPTPPYTTWPTAAKTIQYAVDAADAGDDVLVTNGVYATGGRAVSGTMTNRVAVDRLLTVRSVNGPAFTFIQGYQIPGTTNGDGAVRCVYLTNGATLDGFTITNGATVTGSDGDGGGIYSESTSAVITNCVIVGNCAWAGGGVHNGTLLVCELSGNSAEADGGGADSAVLNNCKLIGNSGHGYGAGAAFCSLNNCLIASNNSGGVFAGTLNNCTVVWNARVGAFGYHSGFTVEPCILNNCIVYFNDQNWNTSSPLYWFSNCCTTPLPYSGSGTANISDDPQFADVAAGDLHLFSTSPCINAGNNAYVATPTDLDGNPRIRNGTVDMGPYEFQGSSGLTGFHTWLAGYGLPSDGSADYVDCDGDGLNNWQEWIAGTNPTNAISALRMVSATRNGNDVQVTWQSILGIGYFLQRATNLRATPPWNTIITNLPGQTTITGFTDTNAASLSPSFYRVGVAN